MSFQSRREPPEILLVEDNPGDALLLKEALRDAQSTSRLTVVPDGVEALAFLRRQGKYSDAVRPSLILLDLNLPKKNGHELLAEIKEDKDLRRIPVMIISSSQSEQDLRQAYDEHANCYTVKPLELEQYQKIVEAIEQFWFTLVELPPE